MALPRPFLSLVFTAPLAMIAALTALYVGGFGGEIPLWRFALAIPLGAAIAAAPFLLGLRRGIPVGLALFLIPLVFLMVQTPSNDRHWAEGASRTAHASIDGNLVTIQDIRDFRYNDDGTWEPGWYDAVFDLDEIRESYFLLTTFGGIEGIGHVMVSFRFGEDQYIVLSVEIRREEGEEYDPIAGVFRHYELMYVAADERDAIALRTNIHQDPTWMIPMNAGPEKTGEFFLDMVQRMTALHHQPEWYNTITSSCSSNLARHYEVINDLRLPPDFRILMPGFSGALLAELGLLPEGVSAEEAVELYRIDEFARELPLDRNYSRNLRSEKFNQRTPLLPGD